jgi:tetratricopeptide (TPR) repeat protein
MIFMVVASLHREGSEYSLGMIALIVLLSNLPVFLIGFALLLFGRRKQKQLAGSAISDTREQFQQGLDLFNQGKIREAIRILETVAKTDPTFAPAQFNLGGAYSRVAEEYGDDEGSVRTWANKSAEAFRKAIDLARRHGGLNDKQLAMAQDAVSMFESAEAAYQAQKWTPSLPEDQRKRIYAEFMQAKDSAFLHGIDMQDLEAASKRGDLAHMARSLTFKGTNAEETVIAEMAEKHKITREQLLAIEREGDAKEWPFKGVKRS